MIILLYYYSIIHTYTKNREIYIHILIICENYQYLVIFVCIFKISFYYN